ncbi:MAG TPA: flagellin [Methanosarcina sp.]|nr:flagellin [Methanosarcina sp.]
MKEIPDIFKKSDIAFNALESAIVLTAFVVMAAVFSYVIIGAEYVTSDTITVTSEGVEQTGSSFELAGGVITKASDSKINNIILTLQLARGQPPVNIGADSSQGLMIISYSDRANYTTSTNWTRNFVGENDGDGLLEQYEKIEVNITAPPDSILQSTEVEDVVNSEFRLEIKPEIGAITPVSRIIPPKIDTVMNLK